MSGTASRFQARLGYAPGLRVGQYPGLVAPAPLAPPASGMAAPGAAPVVARPDPVMAARAAAPGAAPPVMAGSMRPDRLPGDQDGAGGSAQGEYGGPGPSGIGSTGSVLGDIAGFGRDAGLAALGMASPMGVVGFGLGAIASGLANAFGAPQTADAIAQSIGLSGPVGAFSNEAPGFGEAKGPENDPGLVSPENPLSGMEGAGVGGDKGDAAGDGSQGENTSAGDGGSEDGGSKGGDWMRGGYTGAGPDGAVQAHKIAGRVHEGEVVIPASMVATYGLDPLLMIARGQVEPSRLAALLR